MKLKTTLLILFSFFIIRLELSAQCSGGSYGSSLSMGPTWATHNVLTGTYYTFSANANECYQFSFCQTGSSAGFDTELTILNSSGAYANGYNDDHCGFFSEITWTCSTTGTYRILVSSYPCDYSSSPGVITYRAVPPAGPGVDCLNPYVISILPFNMSGLTTCGYGNQYTSSNTCTNAYMNGEDFVFRYFASAPVTLNINLTGTVGSTGVFLVKDCPDQSGALCIPGVITPNTCSSSGQTSINGNPAAAFEIPTAGIYYIIVDTWPSPNCTPFNINIREAPVFTPPVVCYSVSNFTYAPDNFNSGTSISFPDDSHSDLMPLPFTFCFMGNPYDEILISSNAYISFNSYCLGAYSPWNTVPVPTTATLGIQNAILGPWVDIDPSVSGTIKYNTYGTAPYRRFVISYRDVAMFYTSCNSLKYTGQITLYESTNIVENQIENLPNCPAWNGGQAVLGLHGYDGNSAITVSGYNNTQFTLSNFAVRYTPSCAICTSALPVDFTSISAEKLINGNRVKWKTAAESNAQTFSLQRSSNSQDWVNVNEQSANNRPTGSEYTSLDENPHFPATIYRVQSKDVDGKLNFSASVVVHSSSKALSLVGIDTEKEPGNLHLSIQNEGTEMNVKMTINDISGKEILKQTFKANHGNGEQNIDVSGISSGIYFLLLFDETQKLESRKFIIP